MHPAACRSSVHVSALETPFRSFVPGNFRDPAPADEMSSTNTSCQVRDMGILIGLVGGLFMGGGYGTGPPVLGRAQALPMELCRLCASLVAQKTTTTAPHSPSSHEFANHHPAQPIFESHEPSSHTQPRPTRCSLPTKRPRHL